MAALLGAGATLLILAISPPLDHLADKLLTVHMLQHLVIANFAPLLITAAAACAAESRRIAKSKCPPLFAWTSGVGLTAMWHLPGLFNLALENWAVHAVQHISLLAGGILFWWPVFGPGRNRLPIIMAAPYLITACMGCTLVGIVLTFGPPGMYQGYRDAMDQQMAGLIMWMPGCLMYLGSLMFVLGRYYSHE